MPTEEEVRRQLRTVPEPCSLLMRTPLDIGQMGLVDQVSCADGTVRVELVLTDASCVHYTGLRRYITDALLELPGVEAVEVTASTTKLWTPDRLQRDATLNRTTVRLTIAPSASQRCGLPRDGGEELPVARRAGVKGTRGAILEEATRLFGAQGYTGTTMRDIATAVGVLPGSLYTHIDGKETLLLEIVEAGIDKFLALGYAAVAGPGNAEQRLRNLVIGHVAIVAQNAERTLVVFHQWRYLTGENLDRIREKRRQYEVIMTTVVEDGRREGVFNPKLDLKTSVLGLLGALNWTAEWYKADGPESGQTVGERLADSLLLGLTER